MHVRADTTTPTRIPKPTKAATPPSTRRSPLNLFGMFRKSPPQPSAEASSTADVTAASAVSKPPPPATSSTAPGTPAHLACPDNCMLLLCHSMTYSNGSDNSLHASQAMGRGPRLLHVP